VSSPVEDKIVDADEEDQKTRPSVFPQGTAIERGQKGKAQKKKEKPEVEVGKPRCDGFLMNFRRHIERPGAFY
jgi:hypothetical protein